ncbi:hypothetical protein LTR10_018318 [Elasticomyces elasticus]|uniref:5-formyltetrahydrofolate cyclo-ligase n=1 Tax=Exophiala sideris TaxID=1016849 RepID=A0ABR0JMI5_9EURO|nr:hypothetical protein LTR10_018318 [Elasticomyces elasticus]KAK5024213.1 hypothetical protein LTR13_010996 [Exophiala sideris]KAK5036708.1 hypothetical protein LTS07_002436 [Exophiala sideris]KAK5067092.1 hypothetical protein LTR69_002441 [Exophiala sideris]KAK5186734.1 hypothetical protein LTR44_000740 [Eurotiomycetes sp. CCFEE 6388]
MALEHKDKIRHVVWPRLREVALPDSRFHYDFSSFIADFQGSDQAIERLCSLPCYKDAQVVFITPDNCLEELRFRALCDGKKVLVTTYGICRGFWLLDPAVIKTTQQRQLASLLDAMERPGLGKHITLSEMQSLGLKVELMVTGTGAINHAGIRFGKGHGFFDLEWAMLTSINAVVLSVPCIAIVHDCQLLDEELHPEEFDTVCDFIVTPTSIYEAGQQGTVHKPSCGILWDKLQPGMLEDIPPLRELQILREQK